MKHVVALTLLAAGLTSCAPSIHVPDQHELTALDALTDESRKKSLSDELEALNRKAEILERIHSYSPFIRVINVYLPGRQLPTGAYTHPQIVSAPLIYNQSHIKVSSEAIDAIIAANQVKTQASKPTQAPAGIPTEALPGPQTSPVSVYSQPTTVITNTKIQK